MNKKLLYIAIFFNVVALIVYTIEEYSKVEHKPISIISIGVILLALLIQILLLINELKNK